MMLRPPRGFSLLEALVAMAVLAFGILSLAAFQARLSASTDVAKQRSEAVRLAQLKLEELRAYGTIATTAGYVAWNDLPASGVTNSDTPATTTNTSFTRQWRVSGASDDWQRPLWVTVTWTDRANQTQSVRLDSVISQSDPANVGSLNVPTVDNGILRRPKGRDINIPIPAVALGGANTGKSKIAWNGQWLVFNNDTGNIVYLCSAEPTDSTDLASTCTVTEAYLLAGFISGDISNGTASNNYNGLSRGANTTIFASLGIAFASTQYISGTPSCVVANAIDQNTFAVIPGYIAYSCLVTPTDHDANGSTPRVWSGRTNLSPVPTGNSKVCRYTNGNSGNINHPAIYSLVTESLDNQNFYLINNGSCPMGTVQHQP